MNLNDLFDGVDETTGGEQREKTPWMKFKHKEGERVRLRIVEDFDVLQSSADVSHWVDGVGRVKCNLHPIKDKQNPGKLFLWNGFSKGENKNPEYNCKFCEETRAAKRAAADKYGETTPEGKQAVIVAGRLHNRSQQFCTNVEYEVWKTLGGKRKPEVIQELSQALTNIRINDLFSPNGKGEYSLLKNMYENKGTICNNWFTMGADYKLTPDDPLPDDIKSREVELFERPRVLEYKDGLTKYLSRRGEAGRAEPLEEDLEDFKVPF